MQTWSHPHTSLILALKGLRPSVSIVYKKRWRGVHIVEQQVKLALGTPAFHIGVAAQLPANVPRRQQMIAQVLGFLPFIREIWMDSWLLAVAWFRPGCCRHLGGDTWNRRFSLCVFPSQSYCLSNTKISFTKPQMNKNEICVGEKAIHERKKLF